MKHLIFYFTFSVLSLAIIASEAFQVPDTLNLFENITDVSRQIQQQTTVRESIVSPEEVLPDSIPLDAILIDTIPLDTIPLNTILIPTPNKDSIIVPVIPPL